MSNSLAIIQNAIINLKQSAAATGEQVLCREKQVQELDAHLSDFLLGAKTKCLLVTGFPGTGKTHTIAALLARAASCTSFRFNAINDKTSIHSIVCACIGRTVPVKEALRRFATKFSKTPCILMIDEFDMLMNDKTPLYSFFDTLFNSRPRVFLILLSNSINFPQLFHSRLESRLDYSTLFFPAYTIPEIQTIVAARIGLPALRILFNDEASFNAYNAEKERYGFDALDIRRSFGIIYNLLLMARNRIKQTNQTAISRQSLLEMDQAKTRFSPLQQCSAMEVVLLACLANGSEQRAGADALLAALDAFNAAHGTAFPWNQHVLELFLDRLVVKRLIVPDEKSPFRFALHGLDNELVQGAARAVRG